MRRKMKEEFVLNRIKDLMREKNWTLYRLAKESEISCSTLRYTICYDHTPSMSTLFSICKGFRITLSEFFSESRSKYAQMTEADQKLLENYHRLKKDDKVLVDLYINGRLKMIQTWTDYEKVYNAFVYVLYNTYYRLLFLKEIYYNKLNISHLRRSK